MQKRELTVTFVIMVLAALWFVGLFMVAAAYADTVNGTPRNDWSPPTQSTHPNWPLPHDCGPVKRGPDVVATKGPDRMHTHEGCDFFIAGHGNDVVHTGKDMDAGYGGIGNDRIYGEGGHDHLFGDGQRDKPQGNDFLDTRDGRNERGNVEEAHGGGGKDSCWFDADPDGHKFSGCEKLNGSENPWHNLRDEFMNTTSEGSNGDQAEKAKINKYLRAHGG